MPMLLSDSYNTYVTEIIQLVRSFVIKSVQTINSINNYLTIAGDTLSVDPATWKYYRNLAGLPYIGSTGNFNDPTIQVYSLDTNQLMDFTPTNMANSPITLADFLTYGTTYNNLLAKYPMQDMLIRGVLSPVNINSAIAANDYQLLNYDNTLIGAGESTLINDVQTWIYNYASRWDIPAFAATDNLYTAANLGIIYLNLVPTIINIRIKNCKTPYVHEYHLWQYLSGYFDIGSYQGIISYNQALFLYRNIEYIIANAGKSSTLDFLNTGFAFPYGLQLYNYEIRQNLGESLSNLNAGNYTDISNSVLINKYPYGVSDQITDTTQFITPSQLVSLISDQALLNKQNITTDSATLLASVLNTNSTDIPTGIIEGNVVEITAVNMVNVVSERIHNWLYLASLGNNYIKYKYILELPNENVSGVILSPGDAAVLLVWASAKYFKTPITNIPPLQVRDIMVQPTLTQNEIEGVIESKFLSGTIHGTSPVLTWNRYNDVVNSQTYPINLNTLNAFNTYITSVVNNKIQHILLPTLEPDLIGKSEVQSLINLFYQNITCNFVNETTFTQFFTRLGFDPTEYDDTTILNIINTLLRVFMGIVPETNTLQDPYASMVAILRTVSSYMLQFVDGLPTNDIEPVQWEFNTVNIPDTELVFSPVLLSGGMDTISYIPTVRNITFDINTSLSIDINSNLNAINTAEVDAGSDISLNLDISHLDIITQGSDINRII